MGHSLKFAQSCKSGACSKLSKALIEIDVAKERLANVVSFMWESKAAAEAGKGNGTNEVVMDNSHDGKNSPLCKGYPSRWSGSVLALFSSLVVQIARKEPREYALSPVVVLDGES
ncbi:hypothetical protein Sjap_013503 [Stephania japonica]|uniref:Uncharacterized protein n=1 Tax=Stephania japonica TaxID=461633 RepID=A0AAP0J0I3_9MAGN